MIKRVVNEHFPGKNIKKFIKLIKIKNFVNPLEVLELFLI